MTSKVIRRTSAGVKSAVVRKLQSLSITYHKNMQTGKVQSKFLKDTEAIDGLFSNLLHGLLPSILTVIVAVAISVYTNWIVSLFFLVIVPSNVILTKVFVKKLRKNYRDYRVKTEEMSAKMSTMLNMMTVTKSHGLEDKEISSLNDSIAKLTGTGRKVDKITANFGSWTYVIPASFNAICVIFCAIMAIYGHIGVGDIVLYQSMFSQISGSVSSLVNLVPTFSSGLDALSSVSEIMNEKDIEVSIGKAHVDKIQGGVEFKNVYYRYPDSEPDQYVVKNLNLSVKQGECIAVVGGSGSGKSTIMNMIIGFLPPTSGEILIDGKSIKNFNLSEYRHHISVVPQSSILFAGTIRENITYGLDHYTEEQFQKAVQMANVNEFIEDLPNGLETDIGEHGDKLSGGQKQRITIARALIRDPKILILDEATSALDNISEYHVQQAISSSIRGRTTFIVAHRLSTIRDADRIVVMEQGVPVEMGTYEELMEKKGKFYELKALNEINLKTAEEGLS
jgi:ATP-binding cassette subfamily B protein